MIRDARHALIIRRYAKAAAVELPIPPVVLSRLVALTDAPDWDARQISAVVASDPGLGAEALRITNSAAFALRAPVTSIQQAVVTLGERLLRDLIARRMRALLAKPELEGYRSLNEGLWRHAIRTAAAAARLAPRGSIGPGLAYTAGLLADIGKLALARPLRQRWSAFQAALDADPTATFDAVERELLGADHAAVGAEMARRWELPAGIVAAIAHHHAPEAAPADLAPLCAVIHVADMLALLTGVGNGSDGLRYEPAPGAVTALGVTQADVPALMAAVEEDVAHLETLLTEAAA